MIYTRTSKSFYFYALGLCLTLSLHGQALRSGSESVTAVPRLVRISNAFHPANGLPAAPVESVTLSVYSEETGGTPLWQETQNVNISADGHYTVLMGATQNDGVPIDLFNSSEPRWLGVQFNRPGETEQPRVRMASVPYALKASDAETLGGLPASAYLRAPGGTAGPSSGASAGSTSIAAASPSVVQLKPLVTTGANANSIPMFTDTTGDLTSSLISQINGDIGIGTATPGALFDLEGIIPSAAVIMGRYTGSSSQAPTSLPLAIRTSRGTPSSPSAVQQGDLLGPYVAQAWDGAEFGQAGQIIYTADQNWTSTQHGSHLSITTVADGTTSPAVRMYIDNAGHVGVGTSTPAYTLDVAGPINSQGNLNVGGNLSVTGTVNIAALQGSANASNAAPVSGQNTATTGYPVGVQGNVTGSVGAGVNGNASQGGAVGVNGFNSATTGNGTGVWGGTNAPSGSGVSGVSNTTSGNADGVYGVANSPNANGVFGINNSTTGGVGVSGSSAGANGSGVNGFNSYTAGANGSFPVGVSGSVNGPTGAGVAGNAQMAGASGVSGYNGASSGFAPGVNGGTNSSNGPAVNGSNNYTANAPSSYPVGVQGSIQGSNGAAVQANANGASAFGLSAFNNATSGHAVGAQGVTASPAGAALLGQTMSCSTGSCILNDGTALELHAANDSGGWLIQGFSGAQKTNAFGGNNVFSIDGQGDANFSGYVQGISNGVLPSGNPGIAGLNSATSGLAVGVGGVSFSPGGAGVAGLSATCNNSTCSLLNGTGGAFYTSNATGGTAGYLLQGFSAPQGTAFTSATQVFYVDGQGDGYFAGNLTVGGNISKGGGSFRIDHPLDPDNKYLYHSFVESPDMKNIYDGIVVLDENGEASVTLPDWFEALNQDFRYQLTCVGGYAPVYVASEVSGNSFRVAGGRPGLKVSWQLTGIRHDAYANAHRIPVEEEKPLSEREKSMQHDSMLSKTAGAAQ